MRIDIPDKKGLREFGLILGALFAGLLGVLLPWLFGKVFPWWPWIVAGILWSLALFVPNGLKYIYQGWMLIAAILGWINTRLILAIAFYMILTPMSLLMRVVGRNPLRARLIVPESYRIPTPSRSPQHMEHPF